MSFQFIQNYSDPISEGETFRKLITTLDPEIIFPESTKGYEEKFKKVCDWVTDNNPCEISLSYINQFFSKIIIPGGIGSDIIDIWSVEEIIELQSEVAPICNLPEKSGIIQFGSWCGDMSDGDAWCIDLVNDLIICIPVGCGDDDLDYTRSTAYAKLPNFSYFTSYLATSAYNRGWLKNYNIWG